ncbi:hypothetical protein A2U01_0073457, partial [Trifolium medium]|nr:hypothetical protein [Trifolium medium]
DSHSSISSFSSELASGAKSLWPRGSAGFEGNSSSAKKLLLFSSPPKEERDVVVTNGLDGDVRVDSISEGSIYSHHP